MTCPKCGSSQSFALLGAVIMLREAGIEMADDHRLVIAPEPSYDASTDRLLCRRCGERGLLGHFSAPNPPAA